MFHALPSSCSIIEQHAALAECGHCVVPGG